ncbi:DJ-1/PfpI family protein [Capnocytophaga gingivalis]|uniref:DJ-1/PfpI family protein n=1 Tax=Capnocytophaga gingivalis TaxID=1017 RepID=UPI003C71D6A8
MKKVVFIILDKFANWELAYLSAALGEKQLGTAQYSVLYASTDKEVKTSIGNLKALPDLSIGEIPEDISALIFIGAEGSWHNLSKEQTAQLVTLAQKVKANSKVLGAICDSARFCAVNGLLNDVKHTINTFDEIKDAPLYTNGENFVLTANEAVTDHKVVTAKGDSALHFAVSVLSALGDVPEENIQFFYTLHTEGFLKAIQMN